MESQERLDNLRIQALQQALQLAAHRPEMSEAQVVEAAEKFFTFLTAQAESRRAA